MIAIVDYGAGNLRSVANALVRLGCDPKVTNRPADVLNAAAVILPGVGAAADAMRGLGASGLDSAIREIVDQDRPFFAVCIGMQVLLSSSEEGGWHECLGVIPGAVRRLPSGLKVPHMGWNQVRKGADHPIYEGIPDEGSFYFVHSFYAEPDDATVVAGTTEYGVTMCSVLTKGNLVATQFHPERSGDLGLRMYDNFLRMARVKG